MVSDDCSPSAHGHPAALGLTPSSMAIAPTWEHIVKAYSELIELGINSVHINTLLRQMINAGFDAELCRLGIAEAVGCGLLTLRDDRIGLRRDS